MLIYSDSHFHLFLLFTGEAFSKAVGIAVFDLNTVKKDL